MLGLLGVYATPAIHVAVIGAYTNTAPTGPYRGAGRPEASYVVDETGASTNMARRDGRCPVGQLLVRKEPWGHWTTITVTAALCQRAMVAPMVLDGPMDGDAFRAYVAQCLGPILKPGDIVIMDNLPSHKVSGIRETIEAIGAKLIDLPPDSPDLNPIEKAFAKTKALPRKAAARSIDAPTCAIGTTIKTITKRQCAAFFKSAGFSI